ncbi:MAG: hypothetical protein JSW05_07195, partial [Candidatus Thorarchaeota archaeon]
MRKEKSTVLLALLIVFGMTAVVFIVPSAASVSAELPDLEPVDVGPKLRDADYGIDAVPESGRYKAASAAAVGDTKLWLSLDDYEGYYFFTYYELRAVGVHTEVWVQTELSYPEGDPREYPVVTDEQIAQLLGEFESNIYPTDTGYFGATDYHDGTYSLLEAWGYVEPGYYSDDTGKDVILVSNIRDDAYYDSTYPYYIAGFYSSSFEAYFDRNIISIDSHDWANRVGPDGARPYLYEAIIAHEEQHLIHYDYQPDDASYLNEGCSMYAELLCGYGIPWGDINSYLATPDNSLTDWGDQGGINILADYGAAAMWAIYLNDQFGDTFWSQYMANGVPDTLGLEALFGGLTFDEVFHNWKVANLVDSDFGGFYPEYAYTTLDLDSPDAEPIRVYQINEVPIPWTAGSSFGTTTTILGYDTGISLLGPYGSDYISIRKFPKPWSRKLFFDGNDYASVLTWSLADGVWYSGAVDLMNTLITGEAYVDPANPELVLTTYWDIEDYWDFGFVQVSTDGG